MVSARCFAFLLVARELPTPSNSNTPKAVEHLHKAVELQPDLAWANYEIGAALLKTGDFQTAAVHLEIATSRLPECAQAHSLLAQANDHLGCAEDAKRERGKAGPAGQSKR